MKKILLFLLLLQLIQIRYISAQNEYLVTVDPSNGTYVHVNNLPGVNYIVINPGYTTYDKNNHRYFFHGIDTSGAYFLYTVDAPTGHIIYNPPFPVLADPNDNVIELQYDNVTNTLYGLHWDNSAQEEFLVTVDPATGAFTLIDSIQGLHLIVIDPNYTTFDETNGRYILNGIDNNSNSYLYSIDVTDASIASNPLFPVLPNPGDMLNELQYDNTTCTMYGLYWDYSDSTEYLVSVDPATGSFTTIDSIPGVEAIASNPHYTTFDEINHRYIFMGIDLSGVSRLYSVDVNTGNVTYDPPFPMVPDPGDNVIELKCDNSNGTLYALNWEVKPVGIHDYHEPASYNVYPNPFSDYAILEFNNIKNENCFLDIYNNFGQLVKTIPNINTNKVKIERGNLNSGIYCFQLKTLDAVKQTGKFVIQ
jgi:hypothetical protein